MSNPPYDEPAAFMKSIATMDVATQITMVKAYVQSASTFKRRVFIDHPQVKAWIAANVRAINASVVIPKSHGGPGR